MTAYCTFVVPLTESSISRFGLGPEALNQPFEAQLAIALNYMAKRDFDLETLRRVSEKPFSLLVIMKRKDRKEN